MTRNLAATALLAAAPMAWGQSWDFELSNPELSPGAPSTQVVLFADIDPFEYLAGALLDVHASEAGWSDLTPLIPPIAGPPAAQKPGEIMGGSVVGIVAAQLVPTLGFTPFPGRIPVWEATFTVTDFTQRNIELSTDTLRFQIYEDFIGEIRHFRIPIEGSARISVIPAPGGLALLGLMAMTASRRRRRAAKEVAR